MAKWTADFETTTDPNDCRVWAWAVCEINNIENIIYGNTIESFIEWCSKQVNPQIYFHNLAFDGEFILNELFRQGYQHNLVAKELSPHQFSTLISDKGLFYTMKICFRVYRKTKRCATFYDSLKIIPMKVEEVADAFALPLSKGKIDYGLYREPGHILTPDEKDYIRGDVEIMARALSIMFSQGLTQMTQGSNGLHDYKKIVGNRFQSLVSCSGV